MIVSLWNISNQDHVLSDQSNKIKFAMPTIPLVDRASDRLHYRARSSALIIVVVYYSRAICAIYGLCLWLQVAITLASACGTYKTIYDLFSNKHPLNRANRGNKSRQYWPNIKGLTNRVDIWHRCDMNLLFACHRQQSLIWPFFCSNKNALSQIAFVACVMLRCWVTFVHAFVSTTPSSCAIASMFIQQVLSLAPNDHHHHHLWFWKLNTRNGPAKVDQLT